MENDYINTIISATTKGLGVIDIAKKILDKIDVTYNNMSYIVLLLNNQSNKVKYYAIIKDNNILAYIYNDNNIYGVVLIENIKKINIKELIQSDSIFKSYVKFVAGINILRPQIFTNNVHMRSIIYNKDEDIDRRFIINNNNYTEFIVSVISNENTSNFITTMLIYDLNLNDTNKNYYYIPVFLKYKYNEETQLYELFNKKKNTEETSKIEGFLSLSYRKKVNELNKITKKTNNKNYKQKIIIIIVLSLIIITILIIYQKPPLSLSTR
jgi:hypothetical protein